MKEKSFYHSLFIITLFILILASQSIILYGNFSFKKILIKKVKCTDYWGDYCPTGMCLYDKANGGYGGADIAYWMCALKYKFDKNSPKEDHVQCGIWAGPGPHPIPIPLY